MNETNQKERKKALALPLQSWCVREKCMSKELPVLRGKMVIYRDATFFRSEYMPWFMMGFRRSY